VKRPAAVGFERCGCPTFALVLGHGTPKSDERDIAKALKDGLRVEIMESEDVRNLPNFLNCTHGPDPDDPRDPKERAREILGAVR
jgi:hypothetical protein